MGVSFPPAVKADLVIYEGLLRKWQKTINLVAPGTLPDLWTRHFEDSAQLFDLAPRDALNWVDLGSGGGFPGLVIGILMKQRSGGHVHLVESDSRKAAFLRTVSRETGSAVTVHAERLEKALLNLSVPSVISARALAPMAQLLEWTAPLIEKGAIGLFLKGQDVDRELTEISKYSSLQISKVPSRTDSRASIIRVERL